MKKTFAEWVLALTRGYTKVTGKKPDKLSQLKINMEAGQKVRDQEKVIKVDFGKKKPWYKEKEIDWDKVNKIDPEDFAGGGVAGMLGEPTYADENHRVPYGGGGAGKPPITFTLQGGGSYGSNEIGPGLDLTQSGYGFDLGTNIDLPFGFSLTGDVGIGRGKGEVDYNDQNVFTGVDETKLGDKWNVGLKWSKKFNEGGRVPYAYGGGGSDPLAGGRSQIMSGQVLPLDFDELDPDELLHIIKLIQAGEIPNLADGGRAGFKDGKGPKMSRRGFLKAAAGLAALPVVGKFFKWAKPAAKVADLTQVPIQNAEGMPSWFKPLVNRVIKEGVETTKLAPNKGGAYLDRQIVHSAKLGEGQGVRVYQTLDDQTIRVEYQSADNMGGVDDGIVQLEYTAPQEISLHSPEGSYSKVKHGSKKSVKTKAEFSASEAYPYQDPKDYKWITFEGDNTVKNVDGLYSDTSALKQFGTNKTLSKKELEIAKQKRKRVKQINENPGGEELAPLDDALDPDFASGGRVPFKWGGKGKVIEGLAELMEQFFPGTTKLGKTSKPMAEKTQLKQAIAGFIERQKNKKLIDEDIKIRAKELDLDEGYLRSTHKTHIEDKAGVGSLEDFTADFNKELGLNVSKENLRHAWRMKRDYPFSTPIVDKTGKYIGDEATQKMYPKSKKFIVSDEDKLTKEINLKREGRLPSGERAGIDVPDMPAGFKLSREKLIENFPELSLDQIDEIMNLDKEMQGRVITMLKNRRLDPDLYDELLLKHGDTLKFQGEFDKAIRRRKNASGGLAHMGANNG